MRSLRLTASVLFLWTILQTAWLELSSLRPKSRDLIGGVGGGGGSHCPGRCRCRPRAVYCDGIRLATVPRRLPRNLATLRLKDNRIRNLHYETFRRMFDLRHLLIIRNNVSYIEHTAFKDLYSLISLSLSENELVKLSEDTFKHQQLLKELSLSRNRLKSVEFVLSYLENVQVLNLAENQLEKITERTFQGNVAVRILDLHLNRISFIHKRAFRRLIALTFLILRDNPLIVLQVHFHANHNLEQLDIARCQLTSVMKDIPPGLRDLRLSENSIEQVVSDDFKNPSNIQLLVLSFNSIDTMSDTVFEQMTALYDLHLTHNRLSQIPDSLPVSLHGLYASHNLITKIKESSLIAQKRLNILVLSHNQISEIDQKAMHNLKRLVSLDLSYNNIRVLKASVFKRLYSLQRLDLSNNPLFQIHSSSFVGLDSLHILKMSSVEGSDHMKTSSFSDLTSILYLDLSNSSRLVKNLVGNGGYALQNTDTIEDLNLMNSGLRGLPQSLRINLPLLRVIKLNGNPWHCDTNMGWVSQWMRSGDVEFFEPELMVCSTPPKLRGRRLMDLSWNDLAKATSPPTKNRKKATVSVTTTTTTTKPFRKTTKFPSRITKAATKPKIRPTTTTTTTTTIAPPSTIKTTATTAIATTLDKTSTTRMPTTSITTETTASTQLTTWKYWGEISTARTAVPARGGVFLQFKRVRQGDNKTEKSNHFSNEASSYSNIRPPSSLTSSHLPSVKRYLAIQDPQYTLLRLQDFDYMSDWDSSTSEDGEKNSFLDKYHYNDMGNEYNDESTADNYDVDYENEYDNDYNGDYDGDKDDADDDDNQNEDETDKPLIEEELIPISKKTMKKGSDDKNDTVSLMNRL